MTAALWARPRSNPAGGGPGHVKPIAGTDSCEVALLSYVISGRMQVKMDDGSEHEVGPGDVMALLAGHNAWVVGDEPCVQADLQRAAHYVEPSR